MQHSLNKYRNEWIHVNQMKNKEMRYPYLFNFYSELILRGLDVNNGLASGGENISNVRCAEDTVLLVEARSNARASGQDWKLRSVSKKSKECMILSRGDSPKSRLLIRGESLNYLGVLTLEGKIGKGRGVLTRQTRLSETWIRS